MTTTAAAATYTYGVVTLPQWGLTLPYAQEGIAQYFPIRALCEWLAIDTRSQREKLRGDPRYEEALRDVPFHGDGGWRTHLSVRRAEMGLWLSGIDGRRVAEQVRGRLDQFQADLLKAAEQLLFGVRPLAPEGERGGASYTYQVRAHLTCLECGAPHLVTMTDGDMRVEREPR